MKLFKVVKCLKEVNQIKSNRVWHVVFFIWLCFFTYDLNNIIHARVRLICLFVTFFLWINRFKGDFCRLRGLEFFSGFSPNSLIYFYYFLFGISYTYYVLIIFFICTFKRKNISCAKKWGGGQLRACIDVEEKGNYNKYMYLFESNVKIGYFFSETLLLQNKTQLLISCYCCIV